MSDYVTSFIPGGDYLDVTHYIPGGDYLSPSHYLSDLGSSPSVPSSPSIPSSPNAPIDTTGSPWGNAQTPPGVTPDPNLPSPVDLTSSTGTLPSIPGSSGTLGNTIANTIIGTGTKAAIGAGLGALGIGGTSGTSGTSGTGATNLNGPAGTSNNSGFTNFTPGLTQGSTGQVNLGGTFSAPQLYNADVAAQHYATGGEVSPFEFSGFSPKINKGSSLASLHGVSPDFHSMADIAPHFAEGGHIPEFYSEGGAKHSNTYVTGEGDGTSDSVPAMLATGEFVLPADIVSSLGNGNNDSGSKVLDSFLKVIREHKQDHNPKDLPPDSKGPLGYLSIAVKKVGK